MRDTGFITKGRELKAGHEELFESSITHDNLFDIATFLSGSLTPLGSKLIVQGIVPRNITWHDDVSRRHLESYPGKDVVERVGCLYK